MSDDYFQLLFRGNQFSILSEPITYSAQDAEAKTIRASIERDPVGLTFTTDGAGKLDEAELMISSNATIGIANPQINDRLTLDSVDWTVTKVTKADSSGLHTLKVARYISTEKSNENYRIRRG